VKSRVACTYLFLLFTFPYSVLAQNSEDIFAKLEKKKPTAGTITIKQDEKIRNLVDLHISQLKRINGIKGYRISIYFGSGQQAKKDAELARAKFISKYEEVRCYTKFEYPFFKVYVGDFRTRSEAQKFLKTIENDYPDDAFVREDVISFPDK
jgi:hypothetical protein